MINVLDFSPKNQNSLFKWIKKIRKAQLYKRLPSNSRNAFLRFFQPGLTKNASHAIIIYGKMLVKDFPYKYIRTENCMKGLLLVLFHLSKLYD